MALITLAEQTYPTAPSTGKGRVWFDSTASAMFWVGDDGVYHGTTTNAATAAQGAGFATDTYATGSNVLIPSFGIQAKSMIRWTIYATKTAAGTATTQYTIRIGSNASTADTSRVVLTGPAQTAATDAGILTITMTVRSVGASGVLVASCAWDHQSATAGFANNGNGAATNTSAAFDTTTAAGQYIGLSINGGLSAAWTLEQVQTVATW